MLMHHNKKIDLPIRKEPNSHLFSDSNTTTTSPSFLHQKHLPFHTQNQSTPITTTPNHRHHHHHHHLQIKIPPFSTSPHPSSKPTPTHEPHLQNEPFSQKQSTNNTTPLSTPHKRPIMSQSSNLSPSPHLPTFHHHHHKDNPSFICWSSSLPVLLATRRITLKFIHHSCHPTWLKVHLKLFMLISLPSLYLFSSTHYWPLVFHFVCVVVFSAVLVISCNLALPRLPSIRLFLARTLCIIKLPLPNSGSKDHPPVVWSIGSRRKPEKRPNSGSWVQVYSNKDVYEGEFHKGKCSGSGVYYYHMSGRYEGDWIDEKYDGYGVETWAKGSRYRGQYRQGLRHGVGLYRSYTGDVYAGEWCNGQCHGCGVHTCADGSSYVGEFKWGVKHGLGHYHFRNGDRYAGEYFADKMHGFGVYSFGNGHRYEGAWHEGRRQGLGIYTFRNGESQSGHWQSGVLSVSSTQCTLPASPSMVDHSKILSTVQEARRAAEKAVNVAKVDERVNRAVAAANKAATAARVAAVKAVQNRMHQNNNDFSIPIPVV